MRIDYCRKAAKLCPTKAIAISTAVFVLIFTCLLGVRAAAQSESGSAAIEGAIMDANVAVVAGATVTLCNLETGLLRTVTTDARQFQPVRASGWPLRSQSAGRRIR